MRTATELGASGLTDRGSPHCASPCQIGGDGGYWEERCQTSLFHERTRFVVPSVAVVGATGAVGEIMRQVLDEHSFPFRAIKFLASERSAGKTITFTGKSYTVEPVRPEAFAGVDIVLSSTPAGVS